MQMMAKYNVRVSARTEGDGTSRDMITLILVDGFVDDVGTSRQKIAAVRDRE
jgi:hypothetical protein